MGGGDENGMIGSKGLDVISSKGCIKERIIRTANALV